MPAKPRGLPEAQGNKTPKIVTYKDGGGVGGEKKKNPTGNKRNFF